VGILYVIDFTIIRYFFRLLVKKGLSNLEKIVQILNEKISFVQMRSSAINTIR